MNQRIKEIRKGVGATQEEFAKRLNLSRNFIAQIEIGTKEPSERTIDDICREFNVNPDWLKTGEGEPYTLDKAEKATAEYLSHAITHSTTAKDAFLRAVAGADDAMLEAVLQFMQRISEEMKEK